ncbi:MAG: flagellar hook-basal body complex protein [Rhodospirillaceae bacterium]|nr:flagellar hook-basal body complex protein [Rhodospirillaceae bacterium]
MLAGIFGSVVSGLSLNAQRISSAADNIANSTTSGYKPTAVNSRTLVTNQTSINSYSAGGVQAISTQLVGVQGALGASTSSTDLAISGSGFFVVRPSVDGGETLYTRDGSFKPDSNGYLVNSAGYYLQAKNPQTGNTESLNINSATGTADATTNASVSVNLPAGAAVGETFDINIRAHDSLGNGINIPVQFTKKSSLVFTVTVGNVTDNNSGSTVGTALEGDASGPTYSVDVVFNSLGQIDGYDKNGDGTIDSQNGPGIYVPFVIGHPEDLDVNLDLSGTTAFAGDFTVNSISTDGASYGTVSGISVSPDGAVRASFDNGQNRTIGKISVATFTNPNGLEALSGNVYRATDASGDASANGSASIEGGAFEFSNTDIGGEFVNIILAQNAYRASLKAFSAAEDLSSELVNSIA